MEAAEKQITELTKRLSSAIAQVTDTRSVQHITRNQPSYKSHNCFFHNSLLSDLQQHLIPLYFTTWCPQIANMTSLA